MSSQKAYAFLDDDGNTWTVFILSEKQNHLYGQLPNILTEDHLKFSEFIYAQNRSGKIRKAYKVLMTIRMEQFL